MLIWFKKTALPNELWNVALHTRKKESIDYQPEPIRHAIYRSNPVGAASNQCQPNQIYAPTDKLTYKHDWKLASGICTNIRNLQLYLYIYRAPISIHLRHTWLKVRCAAWPNRPKYMRSTLYKESHIVLLKVWADVWERVCLHVWGGEFVWFHQN